MHLSHIHKAQQQNTSSKGMKIQQHPKQHARKTAPGGDIDRSSTGTAHYIINSNCSSFIICIQNQDLNIRPQHISTNKQQPGRTQRTTQSWIQCQHHQHQCNGPVATNSKGTKYISIVMASSGKRPVAVSCPSFSQKSRSQLKLLHRTGLSSHQDASISTVCKPRAPQQTQPNHKVSSNGETTV
ncbi:hypothetical protein Nepgr_023070 [Nepenthes gracilis]|uniref:Uncharacterized protein n=1 Tax=Nepenthes gracilis TaxID=150966 RepID=A0AAD3T018_NEPGR|nr:hypothetical protein Nepgr_023070 [Nepenthes gracilis]